MWFGGRNESSRRPSVISPLNSIKFRPLAASEVESIQKAREDFTRAAADEKELTKSLPLWQKGALSSPTVWGRKGPSPGEMRVTEVAGQLDTCRPGLALAQRKVVKEALKAILERKEAGTRGHPPASQVVERSKEAHLRRLVAANIEGEITRQAQNREEKKRLLAEEEKSIAADQAAFIEAFHNKRAELAKQNRTILDLTNAKNETIAQIKEASAELQQLQTENRKDAKMIDELEELSEFLRSFSLTPPDEPVIPPSARVILDSIAGLETDTLELLESSVQTLALQADITHQLNQAKVDARLTQSQLAEELRRLERPRVDAPIFRPLPSSASDNLVKLKSALLNLCRELVDPPDLANLSLLENTELLEILGRFEIAFSVVICGLPWDQKQLRKRFLLRKGKRKTNIDNTENEIQNTKKKPSRQRPFIKLPPIRRDLFKSRMRTEEGLQNTGIATEGLEADTRFFEQDLPFSS